MPIAGVSTSFLFCIVSEINKHKILIAVIASAVLRLECVDRN